MHSNLLTGCTMVLVLLPPFCLHSKTHFKTCFKKMLMHWNFSQGGHGIIDFWCSKTVFFSKLILDFKIDFLWIFILKIFQTVVSVYILFNLMNVRYVDPTIRFLLIPSQGYSNWISKMYIPLSLHIITKLISLRKFVVYQIVLVHLRTFTKMDTSI